MKPVPTSLLLALLAIAPATPTCSADLATAWTRENLLGFAHELADFVFANHVVTDPGRKVYGMTYEFWKDGKQVQEFGLDSMHDGAWLMSSMMVMHRANPEGPWLERAQEYLVPFYTNLLLQSDRLFPGMEPTNEDKKPFSTPVKGWAPRGWDDGRGFQKNGMKPFSEGFFTASNHLAQDLADALANVWLTTRDPRVGEALKVLREYRREYFGPIEVIEFGAALALKETLPGGVRPVFTPESLNPYYTGLVLKKRHGIPAYDDGLAWQYRQETARGEVSPSFAWHAAARVLAVAKSMELFCDTRPWRDGEFFFDIARHPVFIDGKLDQTARNSNLIWGARGVQFSWIGAAVLPTLRAHPELWVKSAPSELVREDVPARLRKLAFGSVNYWHEVWRQTGVIPSGWHRDEVRANSWTLSDAGNYAHLLHCIGYLLLDLDGNAEWQVIQAQVPPVPLPGRPLPGSVLRLQGPE